MNKQKEKELTGEQWVEIIKGKATEKGVGKVYDIAYKRGLKEGREGVIREIERNMLECKKGFWIPKEEWEGFKKVDKR